MPKNERPGFPALFVLAAVLPALIAAGQNPPAKPAPQAPPPLAVQEITKSLYLVGCGIGDVTWKGVEILGDEQNAPLITLHGIVKQKAEELGLLIWSVSISHSQTHSVAMVVAIG